MLQYGYKLGAPPTPRARLCPTQPWIEYLPVKERVPIHWPNGARLAVWLCPNILHYEYDPPHDPWITAYARTPQPDVFSYCHQEFGSRVGFWRMVETLDRYELPCTAIVNSSALKQYPDLCAAAVNRKWDFVGHGMCNTRFTFGLDRAAELAYFQRVITDIYESTGVKVTGMGGPGPQAATENTPDVLAEAGLSFYTDFFADDQPFPIRVKSGRLISMPYTLEINDATFLSAGFEADQFADAMKRQFDVLYAEGAESGRVMCISLHAHILGQAHRTRYLGDVLKYITSFSDVWFATGSEIAQYYLDHCFDAATRHWK